MSTSDLSAGALGDSLSDFLDLGAGDEERNVQHVVTKSLLELVLLLNLFWVIKIIPSKP